jgi:hypothetical protein
MRFTRSVESPEYFEGEPIAMNTLSQAHLPHHIRAEMDLSIAPSASPDLAAGGSNVTIYQP